jgi:hypothetical protein
MHFAAVLFSSGFHPPTDFNSNFLILVRWIHFLAGITWLGLLYFFTLVNVPLMSQLDSSTKGKVFLALMSRALWWFRWAAVVTVLMGLAYWGNIVAADAHNANASVGMAMGSFFLIWTIVWALLYALLIPGKGLLNSGWVLGPIVAVIVIAAAWLFLSWNDHGWGKQSPSLHRNRRRAGLGDAAERVGSRVADPETNHFLDERQRREWNSGTRKSLTHGADVFSVLTNQCVPIASSAVFHGGGQPLSHVWEVICSAF